MPKDSWPLALEASGNRVYRAATAVGEGHSGRLVQAHETCPSDASQGEPKNRVTANPMKILRSILLSLAAAIMPATAALGAVTAPLPAAAGGAPETTVSPAATASDAAQANAPGADAAPGYANDPFRLKPVEGIGQPIPGGIDFQPQVTDNGQYAYWMSNSILLPLITVISLLVLGLLMWVMFRYRASANPVPSKTSHNTFIEILWTLIPVFILLAIAYPSLSLLAAQYKPAPKDAVTIKVTGYQWYWGYEYPDNGIPEIISKMLSPEDAAKMGEPRQLAVDNRMVVPVGKTVKLLITGSDVIHSFAVPALWTKLDAVPGRLNETTFKINKPGVYYGQCSELCGVDHGFMPIAVEALPEAQFNAWVARQGGHAAGAKDLAKPDVPAETAPSGEAAATAVGDDHANNSGGRAAPATAQ